MNERKSGTKRESQKDGDKRREEMQTKKTHLIKFCYKRVQIAKTHYEILRRRRGRATQKRAIMGKKTMGCVRQDMIERRGWKMKRQESGREWETGLRRRENKKVNK